MSFKSRLWNCRPKTLVEWLILAAVFAILIAFVLPGPKWAASGEISVPVRVTVFDATTNTPIPGALVAIVRAPVTEDFINSEYTKRVSSELLRIQESGLNTNEAGQVTIDQKIDTGASHLRPVSYAHTASHWVLVAAEDYGTVAVPLPIDGNKETQV